MGTNEPVASVRPDRRRAFLATILTVAVVAGLGAVVWSVARREARRSLVSYAEGHWACDRLPTDRTGENAGAQPLRYDATISVAAARSSSGHGSVTVAFPRDFPSAKPGQRYTIYGAWRLDGDRVEVRFDRDNSPGIGDDAVRLATVDGAALDAIRFRIRGGAPGARRQWIPVDVDRSGDRAHFSFTVPDLDERDTLDCRKG